MNNNLIIMNKQNKLDKQNKLNKQKIFNIRMTINCKIFRIINF